ncbi:MAG: hypothetical protein ACK4S2_14220 [Gemmobacter sp.]|uniref:hypothetical protein n=1 Tax=Gemmobacter sp. TaxID=1898957 RepID=UPI00391A669A
MLKGGPAAEERVVSLVRAGNRYISRFLGDLITCQPLLLPVRHGKPSEFSGEIGHVTTLGALSRGDGDEAACYNTRPLDALQQEMLRDSEAGERQQAAASSGDRLRTGAALYRISGHRQTCTPRQHAHGCCPVEWCGWR